LGPAVIKNFLILKPTIEEKTYPVVITPKFEKLSFQQSTRHLTGINFIK
jgi:hypothetical protein